MEDDNTVLEIRGLRTDVISTRGIYHTVRGVNFEIKKGEIMGIVGESGCGKSMTAKSILRLNQEDKSFYEGEVLYHLKGEKKDLMKMTREEIRDIRGKEIAMISQNPMEAFDPLYTIGNQIVEMIIQHNGVSRKTALKEATLLLEKVGITPGGTRAKQYPHEFSGGMLQRAAIGMMVSCGPKLLIADEPTTALDVTMQSQILKLLKMLRGQNGMSILLITHNFGVVAEICDKVCVMYAGEIVESGSVKAIFSEPRHPYTQALLKSIPGRCAKGEELRTIPGAPPNLSEEVKGCGFAPRCPVVRERCRQKSVEITRNVDGHWYRCIQK